MTKTTAITVTAEASCAPTGEVSAPIKSWGGRFKANKLLVSAYVKTVPCLFWPIARLRENEKRILIRRTSHLLISGYWRCANHYAAYAFLTAQKQPLHVARHFHASAQVKLAVGWKVPTILLIREPLEAVASATLFLGHNDPLPLVRFYNVYYGSLISYRNNIVVSDFSRTTGDFNSVITAVNARYHRTFEPYVNSPENEARVQDLIRSEHRTNMDGRIETLPLPSCEKERMKELIYNQLKQPRCAPLLEKAQELYEGFRRVALISDVTCSRETVRTPPLENAAQA